MELLYILGSFFIGIAAAGLFLRSQWLAKIATLEERTKSDRIALEGLQADRARLQSELRREIEIRSSSQAQIQSLQEKLATQRLELEKIGEKFQAEFKNLAGQILDEKS